MAERDLLNMGFVKKQVNGRYCYTKFSIDVWHDPDKPEDGYFMPRFGKTTLHHLNFEQLREIVRKVTPKQSPVTEDELFDIGFSKRKLSDLYYYEKDELTLIFNPANPEVGIYWLGSNRSRQNLTTEQVVLLYNYINQGKNLKLK